MKITDEMVRTARDAYQRAYPGGIVGARNVQMRAALEAVLPHLTDGAATGHDYVSEWLEDTGGALPATPAIDREALIDAINHEFADYPEGLSFVTALDGGVLPPRQVAALAADAVLALIGGAR